jgi:hypothetical protein
MTMDNAEKPAAEVEPSATDKIIDAWFVEAFHREPIATNTQHLNYVRAAVDDLKKRLAAKSSA